METTQKRLPIGSVIALQEAEKKLMIIGVGIKDNESGEEYDYLCVPFPEGFIGSEYMFLCQHDDIAAVHYIGFINAEAQAMRASFEA